MPRKTYRRLTRHKCERCNKSWKEIREWYGFDEDAIMTDITFQAALSPRPRPGKAGALCEECMDDFHEFMDGKR